MLEARNLTKKYKNFTAVDHVSFTIKKGEIFGLLGPNGAGKSTLIKMLTCFWKPSGGDAKLDGVSIKEVKRAKRLMGWAPQEDSFYDKLTVMENLYYFGSLYSLSSKTLKERAEELVQLLGLEGKKNALAYSLSGGMKKRLSIAIALIHDPKILFLDEPTVGVDPISRMALWKVIENIKGKKVTILYTTHYLPEVERLCDRVGIIQRGRLITVDTPQRLKKKYGATLEEAFVKLVEEHETKA